MLEFLLFTFRGTKRGKINAIQSMQIKTTAMLMIPNRDFWPASRGAFSSLDLYSTYLQDIENFSFHTIERKQTLNSNALQNFQFLFLSSSIPQIPPPNTPPSQNSLVRPPPKKPTSISSLVHIKSTIFQLRQSTSTTPHVFLSPFSDLLLFGAAAALSCLIRG